ncbi:MAG: PilZ domain-containing protein [Acidobacteriota bacterium]|jgi:hypothetical protein|nr:PilZ domain-containing protein [Acidobacteriota bacterium]
MDRRRSPRVETHLPVRVWGLDAHSLPFILMATARNISSSGAVIQGIRRQMRPGEIIEVQMENVKAEFRIVWVGRSASEREGEIGIEMMPTEQCIWDVNLNKCYQMAAQG